MILAVGKFLRRLLGALCFTVASSPSIANGQEYDGEWEGPYGMSFVPAASANMPDGRIVAWASNMKLAFGGAPGYTWTGIFDPSTLQTDSSRMTHTSHDMFCPGTATLPDGRIMVTGGANSGTVSIFDPSKGFDGEWVGAAPMNIGRGYHSSVLLADGHVLSLDGSWSGAGVGRRTGEVWSEATGWTVKSGLDSDILATGDRDQKEKDNHYWNFQAPNGLIYHAGPVKQMYWLAVEGDGGILPSLPRGDDLDLMQGAAVMFDVGIILKLGGSEHYKNSDARKSTFVIDINGDVGEERVIQSGDLNQPRVFVNAVVLPTGEVFAVGGATFSKTLLDNFAILTSEFWNPATGSWKELSAQMREPRTYHSLAVLIKDARVWVGGGGLCPGRACGAADHPNCEMYSPPYLFNNDGSPATHPSITSSPNYVPRGADEMKVTAEGGGVLSFVIVRLGAATHSTNLDQRQIPLTVTGRTGNEYTLALPTSSNVLLPGSYYMFVLSDGRVPSLGETVVFMAGNQPPPTTSGGFDIQLNTDLIGADLPNLRVGFAKGTSLASATQQCQEVCARMSACVTFTAVEENDRGNGLGPFCYPKGSVPRGNTHVGTRNSGVKNGDPILSGGFHIQLNTNFAGADLPNAKVVFANGTSLASATQQCQEVCACMSACEAFTAVEENDRDNGLGPTCYPKGSVPRGNTRVGTHNSGVKNGVF